MVSELKNETFYARIVMDVNGDSMEIDARPSDAIALSVRVNAPLFVSEEVMALASIEPETSLDGLDVDDVDTAPLSKEEEERLSIFREFINDLDLDDLET
jgi:bifunctional DNase/RNase